MQEIRIKNLGPIQDVSIELKPITVLLGEQATGKSTIAQCVHFFRSLTEDLAAEAFQLSRHSTLNQIREAIENTIRSKFYIYYGSSRYLDNFDIQFHYAENRFVRIFKGEKTGVEFSEDMNIHSLCERIQQHFDMRFISANRRADALKRMVEEHFLFLSAEKSARFEHDIYYPADRNIATMYSEQFRQIFLTNLRTSSLLTGKNVPRSVHLELMQEFTQRSLTMKELFAQGGGNFEDFLEEGRINKQFKEDFINRCYEILKGKYIITSDGAEKIKITRGKHIDLGWTSSGQQSVVRILQELAILTTKRIYTYRTIEEPEVHLFPKAQNELTELMVMCSHHTGSEFLLTTHSPYFVATFNNLLYAAKASEFEDEEVETIGYPIHLRLPPENFIAYQIQNGSAQSIYQPDEALASISGLDAVSLEIGEKFSQLADILQTQESLPV